MLDNNSTIAAIATANGVGAIGVIRVSGKRLFPLQARYSRVAILTKHKAIPFTMATSMMAIKSSTKS